jgi:hypothetical protein
MSTPTTSLAPNLNSSRATVPGPHPTSKHVVPSSCVVLN